ncbi:glutamate ABC transporter substrate-binding protein [Olsenella sp. HMSC062G07]|uniref:glutamate ABC transporter substrate-binding protein n=1 Tax=Olsenella sp. HMSC062G07 TaxID=1739330 RepID=UPI0008A5909C|nr:glutamate ABC transporter substrate-binding protein [Olsenella sp. HMSC062G07]OFK23725.1 ABC transporter substrate-binding protein [Olsenella sp. HMSC062G07]
MSKNSQPSSVAGVALTRRSFVGASLTGAAALALAACSGDGGSAPAPSGDAGTTSAATSIDTAAFASLLDAGTVADASAVEASAWAKAVKDRGRLLVGGVETSTLFSQLDDTDGKLYGFDAGLAQLLARYVLGDQAKFELTKVTSDTRESVLQNNQVDCVLATYSITDDRKKVISFAGPYYNSRQGILVAKDNADINGVEDLAGKNVAVQSGSTGPDIMTQTCPDAKQQLFKTSAEAQEALMQGRVDAYVVDRTMQESTVAKQPDDFKLVGEPFGPNDSYGIGLPLDSDGVAFVNAFLQDVEDNGSWEKLWKICIGNRTGQATAPQPPAIA